MRTSIQNKIAQSLLVTMLIATAGLTLAEGANDELLTLENILTSDMFSANLPAGIMWLPDGSAFLFRQQRDKTNGLWRYDAPSGNVVLVADWDIITKQLGDARPNYRRPSMDNVNSHPNSGRGASVSPDETLYLGVANNDIYVLDIKTAAVRYLTNNQAEERFPTFSPDSGRIGFARDGDLYTVEVATGKEQRLTDRGNNPAIFNGVADWIYEEELHVSRSFWWSPKGDKIAYLQFDVSTITTFPITDELDLVASLELQKYPKAGGANAAVKLGVIASTGGATTWLCNAGPIDVYIARVGWLPDASAVWYQLLNRKQNRLELRFTDPISSGYRQILTEVDKTWVNVTDDLFFVDKDRFILSSQRDGWRHLYLYQKDGTLIKRLTQGKWEVDEVLGLDSKGARIFFRANLDDLRERQICSVKLDGSALTRLTTARGTHSATMALGGAYFIDEFSTLSTPSRMDLVDGNGAKVRTVAEGSIPALATLKLQTPEFGIVKADDGETLYTSMIRPPDFDPKKKYPVLVYVYGGPGTQLVTNSWAGARGLFLQLLARKGLVIFTLDNRGSSGRGHAFESMVYRRLGQLEVADQVAGVKYLKTLPWIDGERIGVYGGSYGGYMTLMCMNKAPEHFKVGIAYAPVTDWRLYDSIYTERYMDLPKDNPEGYRDGAPLNFAKQMTGRLLICHGTMDNNVHLQNSIQIAEQYIEAGKLIEMMLYPRVRHGIRMSQSRLHFHQLKVDFLMRNLIKDGPKN